MLAVATAPAGGEGAGIGRQRSPPDTSTRMPPGCVGIIGSSLAMRGAFEALRLHLPLLVLHFFRPSMRRPVRSHRRSPRYARRLTPRRRPASIGRRRQSGRRGSTLIADRSDRPSARPHVVGPPVARILSGAVPERKGLARKARQQFGAFNSSRRLFKGAGCGVLGARTRFRPLSSRPTPRTPHLVLSEESRAASPGSMMRLLEDYGWGRVGGARFPPRGVGPRRRGSATIVLVLRRRRDRAATRGVAASLRPH